MSRAIKESTKLLQLRGTGTGADYKPWIRTSEFNSSGTAASFPDWKHGRMVQCLSQSELWVYMKLRWMDTVADIREQFPLLPKEETTEIAKGLGIKPAMNGGTVMTTDFLVTKTDGSFVAVSVKSNQEKLKDRDKELAMIEASYWKTRGVPHLIVFRDSLCRQEFLNIREVTRYYMLGNVLGDISLTKYLIANKKISVDMTKPIDFKALTNRIKEETEWKKMFLSVQEIS